MAVSGAFSLASNILSTISPPALDKAYERGLSIWEASDELDDLRVTIESIKDVLLDAEKKQKGSVAVKNWIKRVKSVLYDAEDFFDEVATDDLLKQQMGGKDEGPVKKKVRLFCDTVASRDSIAQKVKEIRERLLKISNDMGQFGFVSSSLEEPVSGIRADRDPGSFVDPKYVFGRDEDKTTILEMLFNESSNAGSDVPGVISIVGIGGMGKTTLAQLIYNDEEVTRFFETKWFACISDTKVEKEVLGEIFQSVCGGSYGDFKVDQLQTQIKESMNGKKFLLVLDDVWDDNRARWQKRMGLLGGGAKGSMVIVTTRSSVVSKAVGAFRAHNLEGLSEDESWALFKSVAFTPEQENHPGWTALGREIVKKCARVPLAIKSIGSLLYTKDTVLEWESFIDQELSKLQEQSDPDSIMSVLRLSYDHLPSNLKPCFAYCSIFPKDYYFDVQQLVHLWIAQRYIKPNEGESVEVAGHSYFISLLRRSFFQEAHKNQLDEIAECKMHDLVHDLAEFVVGEEVKMLKASSSGSYNNARHISVDCGTDDAGKILQKMNLNMRILRSLIIMKVEGSCVSRDLDQHLRSGKYLRALSLSNAGIEDVPSCIGELKLLRYLDLSGNYFTRLPDSMSYLLNLVALDLHGCYELEALPGEFRKLINLGYLNIDDCQRMNHMPAGFGDLGSLRYLSNFKVGRKKERTTSSEEGEEGTEIEEEEEGAEIEEEEEGTEIKMCGLEALARLRQLRGSLRIDFEYSPEDWDGDEWSWQPLVSLQKLSIHSFSGNRIPHWANNMQLPNLVRIELWLCKKVKYLPRFRYLPYLKSLLIYGMEELEYIEEEEEETIDQGAAGSGDDANSLFFPCLEELSLMRLHKWKGGWSRRDDRETTSTPPPMPMSTYMQQHPHLSFPVLSKIYLHDCPEFIAFPLTTPGLLTICFEHCNKLKKLSFSHLEVVEELSMFNCPGLELGSVDWDSLPNLRLLWLDPLPPPEELPECLLHRQTLGKLQIKAVLGGQQRSIHQAASSYLQN